MKKYILVATDFSSASVNAVKYAIDMAADKEMNVEIIHVFPNPIAYSNLPLAVNAEDLSRDAHREMEKLHKKFNTSHPEMAITTKVLQGDFLEVLKIECAVKNPWLVIMGTQGNTGSETTIFGSHTVIAMQHLAHSVLAVPKNGVYAKFQKIGLASELHKVLERTPVQKIKDFVQVFEARLHILNYTIDNEFDPELPAQFKKLTHMLQPLKTELDLLGAEEADAGLVEFAADKKFDLLIVVPHKRTLLNRLFHRSHTKRIVMNTRIPVLSVHL
jgi:nucleotide-binding universal stress UspA family protein